MSKNRIKKGVLYTKMLFLLLTSGCSIQLEEESMPSYEVTIDDEEEIKVKYIYNVIFDDDREIPTGNYTKEDLKHIISATICMGNTSYEYLNYMTNLESLSIIDNGTPGLFQNIDGSNFKKDIEVRITAEKEYINFTEERYGFLKEIASIKRLTLGKIVDKIGVDGAFLESLTNVHNLELSITELSNYQYHNLSHLESLKISGKPYNIAIYFSDKDISTLNENGVEVTVDDYDKFKIISQELDESVDKLIASNKTETEKLNIILSSVLNKCSYDFGVIEDLSKNKVYIDTTPFYRDGKLSGVFENETQICGNYAALTVALSHRLDLESYYVHSNNHAWVTVKIAGEYYYTDPTFMDNDFIIECEYVDGYFPTLLSGEEIFTDGTQYNINQLKWYLVDPIEIDDYSHKIIDIPYFLEQEMSTELELKEKQKVINYN